MTNRARWAADARDFTDDIEAAVREGFTTVGKVSDATGLSPETILDPLTREPITNPDNPRGALCRPAGRIGDVPLWSPEQVAEYSARAARAGEQPELPQVTVEEAAERGLISTEEIAALLNVHDQTVRRWQRNISDYPPAVARRVQPGRPGVREHVRERDAVVKWAREKQGLEPVAA